mgnify:CR=1 FL=1
MSRETVFVSEKKSKIEKVKRQYKNMSMSDETANKIVKLNTLNNILKTATGAVGLITVIDFFVPDPVLGLDEAALTALTGLLGYASSVVNNKIDDIATSDNTELKMEEITKLTGQLTDVASKVKNSRKNTK